MFAPCQKEVLRLTTQIRGTAEIAWHSTLFTQYSTVHTVYSVSRMCKKDSSRLIELPQWSVVILVQSWFDCVLVFHQQKSNLNSIPKYFQVSQKPYTLVLLSPQPSKGHFHLKAWPHLSASDTNSIWRQQNTAHSLHMYVLSCVPCVHRRKTTRATQMADILREELSSFQHLNDVPFFVCIIASMKLNTSHLYMFRFFSFIHCGCDSQWH